MGYTLFGCNSNSEQTIDKPQPAADSTVATVEELADTTLQPKVELILRASGETPEQMKFDQDTLFVTQDALVNLTLINESTNLNSVHNFVLTTNGMYKEVAMAGAKIGPTGNYIPESKHVLAYTPIARPGQTITTEFKAPPPGTYDFVCTYPDHLYTMHGKLVVK